MDSMGLTKYHMKLGENRRRGDKGGAGIGIGGGLDQIICMKLLNNK